MEFITKNRYVYERLRTEILKGVLKQGEKLIVDKLAKKYGVSSMPVREAILRLQEEGLVESIPHVGARVYKFDYDELIELTQISMVLEIFAAKMAACSATEATIEELEAIIKKMEDAINSNDQSTYSILNRKFHLTIYNSNNNRKLRELINQYNERTHTAMVVIYQKPKKMSESILEHKEWLKALKNRDSQKSSEIAKVHKLRSINAFIDSLIEFVENPSADNSDFYIHALSDNFLDKSKEEILDILTRYKQQIDMI